MKAKVLARNIWSGQFGILGAAALILFITCVFPFLNLITKILFSGAEGTFTIEPFLELFRSEVMVSAIQNTLWVSLSVAILSTILAVPLAWLISRTDFPFQRRMRTLLCLPYAIPPYVGAIAWIFLANPSTGFLNHLFGEGAFNIYTFGGLVWVETSFMYTFILLTTLSSLERMDSSFEEAARLSGAGPVRIFFEISVPLMRPALISGFLLIFLSTAASFGVPALIGGPARVFMVTTQIYTFQKMGSLSGLYKAGALSILLLLAAVLTIIASNWALRKNQFQTVSGKTARPSLIELGRFRTPLLLAVSTFVFITLVLPLIGVLISALSRIQGETGFSNLTIDNFYRVLFETDETPRALFNSLYLGVTAGLAACGLGLVIAYIQQKTKVPGRSLLDVFASLPYSAPGTVVALALILTFSQGFLGVGPSLYNTLGMLWLAYVVKYLSFSVKTNADGYRQIDDVLAEAARVSGANWTQTLRTVWLPLMKPSLIAAFFLVFMPVVSELTMTVLLTGPGLETIGSLVFQLQEYADASGGSASVLALLVVLMVIALNWVVKFLSKGKYGL